MKIEYCRIYSSELNRDMEFKIYGHYGTPVLFIPCQDGRFYDFENYQMIDYWQPFIDAGKCTVFAIDTIDSETWSNKDGDLRWRSERYEKWIWYIVNEMVPIMKEFALYNGQSPDIMAFGSSLGATHAVNLYFRFPDIFTKLLALSGIYTADYGFDGYVDDLVYKNSPMHFLPNMPKEHPFYELYEKNQAVICVGQGPWEMPHTTRDLQYLTDRLEIPIWYDYWGYDCAHDWDWWYKQVTYFLPQFF